MTDNPASRVQRIEAMAEAMFEVEFGKWREGRRDHNRWTWRGDGHGEPFKDTYRLYAAAALDALEALEVP